jgi:hypothetical protein
VAYRSPIILTAALILPLLAACGSGSRTDTPAQSRATQTAAPPPGTPLSGGAEPAGTNESCAIAWQDAGQQVGQVASIQGPVVASRFAETSQGRVTVLAVGAEAPQPGLDIVISSTAKAKFPVPPESLFVGMRVCVRGPVAAAQGRSQISIDGPDEITVVPATAPTPVAQSGACTTPISPADAAAHAGEMVAVRGAVAGSRSEDGTLVIELGAPAGAPGGFDIEIPQFALGNFSPPADQAYAGETICVTGFISIVDGRPRTLAEQPAGILVQPEASQ